MPESSEKGYFDRAKLIIEVENIFGTQIIPLIIYETGLSAVFG